MPGARIDRLAIDLPGGSPAEARKLAQLVAAGLADAGALPRSGALPSLRLTVETGSRIGTADLARRIVAATLRELARVP